MLCKKKTINKKAHYYTKSQSRHETARRPHGIVFTEAQISQGTLKSKTGVYAVGYRDEDQMQVTHRQRDPDHLPQARPKPPHCSDYGKEFYYSKLTYQSKPNRISIELEVKDRNPTVIVSPIIASKL